MHGTNLRRAAGLAIAGLSATTLLAFPVLAEEEAVTVDATVTATSVEACLTIDSTTLAFGDVFFTPPGTTRQQAFGTTPAGSAVYTLTSCSDLTQRFSVRGTAATGAGDAAWALYPGGGASSSSPHPCTFEEDTFILEAFHPTQNSWVGVGPEVWRTISGGASVSPGASQGVRTRVTTPCVGSSGDGVEMSFQLQYLAEMTG